MLRALWSSLFRVQGQSYVPTGQRTCTPDFPQASRWKCIYLGILCHPIHGSWGDWALIPLPVQMPSCKSKPEPYRWHWAFHSQPCSLETYSSFNRKQRIMVDVFIQCRLQNNRAWTIWEKGEVSKNICQCGTGKLLFTRLIGLFASIFLSSRAMHFLHHCMHWKNGHCTLLHFQLIEPTLLWLSCEKVQYATLITGEHRASKLVKE